MSNATATPDDLIPLADVPALAWMPRKGGKKIHLATVHRWAQRGVRGVRLCTVRVGGARCTSERELRRFFAAIDGDGEREAVPAPSSREHERAVARMRARGVWA